MLDLNAVDRIKIPEYKVKIADIERSYDALVFAYAVRSLEGVEDPTEICNVVRQALKLEDDVQLSTFDTCAILQDFHDFGEKHLDEPLKKVFGRSLFSTTTSDSPPTKSDG